MTVRIDLMISLDGRMTTTDQTSEKPFGEDWGRITAAYAATRTVRERVFNDTSGEGTTGMDDEYARAYFENVGAEIIGAGMFGLHDHPADLEWKGWWGAEPPFRVPVFVLTHTHRPDLKMAGGTTFHFVSGALEDVLDRAVAVADGKDVRIGGGADVARAFLRAGLIDRLHVAIAPIVIGSGDILWEDLRGLESDYAVTSETAESGTLHLTFSRLRK